MLAPTARGPMSSLIRSWLVGDVQPDVAAARELCRAGSSEADAIHDDDLQLALWMLYELHYGGFAEVDERWEWSPACIEVRGLLEERFEDALRRVAGPLAARFQEHDDALARTFFDVVASVDSPALTPYLQRRATQEQMREFLIHRTVYHLKEADPHAWAVPRLTGSAKVALVELLYDEYGAGRPERLHSRLFSETLEACGLDTEYGAYFDRIPAVVLAVNNAMSLFGLHRRLRAAAMGHLAAFEATSSLPARRISLGLRRLGFPETASRYYEEHVEADAVHEQVAVRSICGSLVAEDPRLLTDVAFGAATCLCLDDLAAAYLLDRWESGGSGLRPEDTDSLLTQA